MAQTPETGRENAKLVNPRLSQSIITLTISIVGKFYSIPEQDILTGGRNQDIVHARHVAMYILREHYKISLSEIARKFNEMDHTTVRHAFLKIQRRIDREPGLVNDVEFLTKLLDSYKEMLAQNN
jgi:chromosomal replication initiator protein